MPPQNDKLDSILRESVNVQMISGSANAEGLLRYSGTLGAGQASSTTLLVSAQLSADATTCAVHINCDDMLSCNGVLSHLQKVLSNA